MRICRPLFLTDFHHRFLRQFGWSEVYFSIESPSADLKDGPFAASSTTLMDRIEHIAEQCSLLNRVIKSDMRMGPFVKPCFGHVALGGVTVRTLHCDHGESLDIQCRMRKRAFTGKTHQIPVHKHKVISHRIADKNRPARQLL